VVSYDYDAWGKILTIGGSMASTLGTLNPLRYRGYVYDQETGLYYLQSRYYTPEWGRFLNADVFVSTGQGLLGNNMFAYCLNNPSNYHDPSGNFCLLSCNGEVDLFTRGVTDFSFGGNLSSNGGGGTGVNYRKKFRDFITNTSEEAARNYLDIHGFAFYKGDLVISVSFLGSAAATFGIIFMGSENLERTDFANTLKHEHGHAVHMRLVGNPSYLITTAIPSLAFAAATNIGIFPYEYYYDLPWERIANYLGGAEGHTLPMSDAWGTWYYLWTVVYPGGF